MKYFGEFRRGTTFVKVDKGGINLFLSYSTSNMVVNSIARPHNGGRP